MSRNESLDDTKKYVFSGDESSSCERSITNFELAPDGLKDIDRYRKEAKDRIDEWLTNGKPPEKIHFDGYLWRNWVHGKEVNSGWSWAMWEQIQILSNDNNYLYKEKLEEIDIINKPNIEVKEYYELIYPDWINLLKLASEIITKRRDHNTVSPLINYLRTDDGKRFTLYCQRILWGEAFRNKGKKLPKAYMGATSNCKEFSPYAGLSSLFEVRTFDEALETEIEVYRGVEFDIKPSWAKKARIESWTTCPEVARLFAEGFYNSYNNPGQGKVLERKIKLKEIMAYINPDGEYEIIIKPKKETA